MKRAQAVAEGVHKDLTPTEVQGYFKKFESVKSGPSYPPIKAEGGEIYYFTPLDDICKSKSSSRMINTLITSYNFSYFYNTNHSMK